MVSNCDKLVCRVCGLIQLEAPWGEDGQSPNYHFCSCCGVEFGYQDSSIQGMHDFRKAWLERGADWDAIAEKPNGWNAIEQMKSIPKKFG